ncbi:MAG: tRNA pseudouridine(55) synthase TruB [Bacillota bacterium]|jgi:tRNA pseudouridine(55) synthase|nr:tRNA pseudouridine(55) synthase TruB [Candidatus Fermentithermobacillaceae bacterium]
MDGFLNVLKPKGITSHDAVLQVRRVFKQERVGHLGTLDPMAVGVLPMALGCYTRLSEYLLNEDKEYLTEFVFGVATDTCDLDGRITSRVECDHLTAADVTKLLAKYTGSIKQNPPAYSAVHVKGRRLHELARRGIKVEAPARDVKVHEFRLLSWKPGPHPRGIFRLGVGRGTYVRSLARDLGNDLGCGAAVSYLLRTRVGNFTLRDAVPLGSIGQTRVHPRGQSRAHTPRRTTGDMQGLIPVHTLPSRSLRNLLSDPYAVLSAFPLFEIKRDSLTSVVWGRPLNAGDFADPAKVRDWLKQVTVDTPDKQRVFFGTYPDPVSGRHEVACVLSAVTAQDKSCRIKYEKVLVQEE